MLTMTIYGILLKCTKSDGFQRKRFFKYFCEWLEIIIERDEVVNILQIKTVVLDRANFMKNLRDMLV